MELSRGYIDLKENTDLNSNFARFRAAPSNLDQRRATAQACNYVIPLMNMGRPIGPGELPLYTRNCPLWRPLFIIDAHLIRGVPTPDILGVLLVSYSVPLFSQLYVLLFHAT